jgi:preprotein translocase subunit YajC
MRIWTRVRTAVAAVAVVSALLAVGIARGAQPPGLIGTIGEVTKDSLSIKPANGPAVTVKVNEATVVKVSGKSATGISDLKAGMRAMVLGEQLATGQAATEIRAYPPPAGASQPGQPAPKPAQPAALVGIITEVGNDTVSIKPANGPAVAIKISPTTVLKVGGQPATGASDLKVGMRAVAFGEHLSTGQAAMEIRAYALPTPAGTNQPSQLSGVMGTITEVGKDSISFKPANGPAVTVKINAATAIKVSGKPAASASDLKAGMRAMAIGDLSTGQAAT